MNILIYILLILNGVFFKNKIKIYDIFIILFLCLITFFSNDVADFENYEKAYTYISNGNIYNDLGIGWYYLCKFGSFFNLTYIEFKIIIIFFSCILIRKTVNYFIDDYRYSTLIWSLYLIYPSILDCVQVRYFLAEAIVIFSIRYLILSNIKNNIKYICLILIAFTIHSSSIFYIILLFIQLFGKKQKLLNYFIYINIFIIILMKQYIIRFASLFINVNRIERYFYSDNAVGIYGIFAYMTTIIFFIIISNSLEKISKKIITNIKFKQYLTIFKNSNKLMSIVLPLTLFDTNFFRIQRPMWLLLYIAGVILIKNNIFVIKNLKIRLILFLTAILGNVFYISYFTFDIIKSFLL